MRKASTHWLWKYKIWMVLLGSVAVFALLSTVGKTQNLVLPKVYHQEAIDIALKVAGFDTVPDILVSARREVLAKDNTPLLHERIIGRPLWRVTIANVKVSTRDGKKSNPYIHAFDVLVDAETGQVLKIISLWSAAIDPKEEVRALISTRGLDKNFRNNNQCFSGNIPKDLPKITFLQLVKKMGGIPHAKHIEGIYVMFKLPPPEVDTTPRPAWVIIRHGFPPHRISGRVKRIPADAPTVAFDVIDATTGKWLLGGESRGPANGYRKYMK